MSKEEALILARGQQCLQQGNFQEALGHFSDVLRLNAQSPGGLQGQFACLVKLAKLHRGDLELCESYLQRAFTIFPDDMDIASELACVRRDRYSKRTPTCAAVLPEVGGRGGRATILNLVFQGGGIKGLAYIGALEALERNVDFRTIQRVGGTSAGAINALGVGLGYTVTELKGILEEFDFKLLMDGKFRDRLLDLMRDEGVLNSVQRTADTSRRKLPLPLKATMFPTQATRIASNPHFKVIKEGLGLLGRQDFGLFVGDFFRLEWIEKLIQNKTGIPYLTFAELKKLQSEHPRRYEAFKDIYFVGTNLTTGYTEVFSYETTPDAIISDALRISMSIPLIFTPHKLFLKQNDKRVPDPRGCLYVDGGLLSNYPLWLFDDRRYATVPSGTPLIPLVAPALGTAAEANPVFINPFTLGFRLVDEAHKGLYESSTAAASSSAGVGQANVQLEETDILQGGGLNSYLFKIIQTFFRVAENEHLNRRDSQRTVYINHLGVKTTEFDLTTEQKEQLIKSGKDAVTDYFKQWKHKEEQLLSAIQAGQVGLIQNLLEQGVFPDVLDDLGNSALDLALSRMESNPYVILLLVFAGATVCKQPARVREYLLEAQQSPFVDKNRVQNCLRNFPEIPVPSCC